MTATPTPDQSIDQAWSDHLQAMGRVAECRDRADDALRQMITTLRIYRMHKRRTITPEECDYGLVCEAIIELERVVEES